MNAVFASAYILLSGAFCLSARDVTGTLYSEHSGPSANGTGEVQLATADGLVSILFQKPFDQHFAKPVCYDLGAVWTILTQVRKVGGETLLSARCDGTIDVEIHSAWLAARNYLDSAAERVGLREGQSPRGQPSAIVDLGGVQIDISKYFMFGQNGMCLEINKRVNSRMVIIRTGLDYPIRPLLDFEVTRSTPTTWHVVAVHAIDELH